MIGAFFTGLIQVFLVAYQGRQIVNGSPLWAVVLVGMAISAIWVFNVRAVTSDWTSAAAYVLGAGIGTGLAMVTKIKKGKNGW